MDVEKAQASDRRQFLTSGTMAATAMAGGLAAGYGMFLRCAGQYLYPSGENREWMYVADTASIAPGQAITFRSATGISVVIARKANAGGDALAADAFIALSDVCPHLGCRVHWEPQNNRFFCPCHLGSFDPEGKPTGGPPLSANQALPQYELKVEGPLLYILMPAGALDRTSHQAMAQRKGEDKPSDTPIQERYRGGLA